MSTYKKVTFFAWRRVWDICSKKLERKSEDAETSFKAYRESRKGRDGAQRARRRKTWSQEDFINGQYVVVTRYQSSYGSVPRFAGRFWNATEFYPRIPCQTKDKIRLLIQKLGRKVRATQRSLKKLVIQLLRPASAECMS